MADSHIYLDNHSTTRVAPAVVDAMLPFLTDCYGNPGSQHAFGEESRSAIDAARTSIADAIHATEQEIVFTSGATESNNLAFRGIAAKHQGHGRHFITLATEHRAVLDPLARLKQTHSSEIDVLSVLHHNTDSPGVVDINDLSDAIRSDTVLVSVMLANNEIGVLQPIEEIARLCHERGALLHCDATQAVGKMDVDVRRLDVDLLSFSAHKIYGPRGIGALYIRRRPRVRIEPQIDGGGQQQGRRSGTLNTPGIVGFAKALELCIANLSDESSHVRRLRDQLWAGLSRRISGVHLNGPSLEQQDIRLPGNLNVRFEGVDAESLMLQVPEIAVSTGSACTAENPEPSHVLLGIGCSDDEARSSIRFGIGRFNTRQEIDITIERICKAVESLRDFA